MSKSNLKHCLKWKHVLQSKYVEKKETFMQVTEYITKIITVHAAFVQNNSTVKQAT